MNDFTEFEVDDEGRLKLDVPEHGGDILGGVFFAGKEAVHVGDLLHVTAGRAQVHLESGSGLQEGKVLLLDGRGYLFARLAFNEVLGEEVRRDLIWRLTPNTAAFCVLFTCAHDVVDEGPPRQFWPLLVFEILAAFLEMLGHIPAGEGLAAIFAGELYLGTIEVMSLHLQFVHFSLADMACDEIVQFL